MAAENVFALGREIETGSEIGCQIFDTGDEINMEEPQCSKKVTVMEMETAVAGFSSQSNEKEHGMSYSVFSSEKVEEGRPANVVFSRESPLRVKEDLSMNAFSLGAEKLKSRLAVSDCKNGKTRGSSVERIELS